MARAAVRHLGTVFRRPPLLLPALLALACSGAPPAPTRSPYELALQATTGERHSLVSEQGKVVAVYFFATWCLPCLQELRTLEVLQNRYREQGFAVVAVGLDLEGARVLRPFAEQVRPPFPVLVADDYVRSGRSPYGVIRAIPTSVLLDRAGKVAAAYEGPADPAGLEKVIGKLVAP